MMMGMAPTPTFLSRQGVTPTALPRLMRVFCAVRQLVRADGRVGTQAPEHARANDGGECWIWIWIWICICICICI